MPGATGISLPAKALVGQTGTAANRPAASTVPAGYLYYATDTVVLSISDGTSTWTTVASGAAGVSSVFGRAGAVVAASNDYTAQQIGPSGVFDIAENLAEGVPATMRTNLGLGTAAVANKVAAGTAGVLDATDPTTTNSRTPSGAAGGDLAGTFPNPTVKASVALSGTPTAPTATAGDNTTQIATDAFVTTAVANAIAGVNPAVAVQAATTAAGDTSGLTYNNGVGGIGATLTGTNNTALTVDGFTFTTLGQRLLVKNDTVAPSGARNGIYYVTQVQALALPPILTRALDYDAPSDINNTGAIPVVNGTANATTSWLLTSTVNTVGTDPLTYTQFSYNPSKVALLASPAFTGVPTAPTGAANDNSTQIATDAFVTAAVAAVNPLTSVAAATTAAADTSGLTYNNGSSGVGATLTGTNNTAITIDGFTFTAVGQRLLVKNDTVAPSGARNGAYSLTQLQGVGVPPVFTRTTDYNTPTSINAAGLIPVDNGTTNANTSWNLTSVVVTVGTSPLTYVQATAPPTGVVYVNSIQTLTNKRVQPRMITVTQSATPTTVTDNGDIFTITGLAQAITSMTTNLSGTPVDGEKIEFRITDNGTARAITWGAKFASTTVTLPAITVISTRLRVSFEWDATAGVWACIGTA